MYCSNNPLQIKTIPMIIGMPILNGSIKWKCDYKPKKIEHTSWLPNPNELRDGFSTWFYNSRLRRSIHFL